MAFSPANQLDYGRQSRRHWKIWMAAIAFGIGSCLLVYWSYRVWAPRWIMDYQRRRFIAQASAFTLPPTTIVYEEDALNASILCAADPNFIQCEHKHGACYRPPFTIYAAGRFPVFFLHERRSGSGRSHIVQILPYWLSNESGGVRLGYCFDEKIMVGRYYWPGLEALPAPPAKIRIFAGQADGADGSHLTLVYEADGRPGIIDGWLMDDDTVKLQIRPGKH